MKTILVAFACTLSSAAMAQSTLTDGFGPRELATGEAHRGNAHGASAISLNPAGIGLTQEMVAEGSYGFRPSDSASMVNVSICDSTSAIAGCYYYRYITATPKVGAVENSRRSHEGGIALSRKISQKILLGTNTKFYDYNTDQMDQSDSKGFAFDAGLLFKPTASFGIGVTGYNLFGSDDQQYPLAVGAGLSFQPIGSLSLVFDSVFALDDKTDGTRFGGGAEFFLRTGPMTAFPLRAGAVRDVNGEATYVTGGAGYASKSFALDLGVHKQVQNGDDLMVLAAIRIFGPRQTKGSLASKAQSY